MPIGRSPPCVLPLPPCPILPSLLPFPFPWTLSLRRRWCPSAAHHSFPFLSFGRLCQRSPRTFPVSLLRLESTRRKATAFAVGQVRPSGPPTPAVRGLSPGAPHRRGGGGSCRGQQGGLVGILGPAESPPPPGTSRCLRWGYPLYYKAHAVQIGFVFVMYCSCSSPQRSASTRAPPPPPSRLTGSPGHTFGAHRSCRGRCEDMYGGCIPRLRAARSDQSASPSAADTHQMTAFVGKRAGKGGGQRGAEQALGVSSMAPPIVASCAGVCSCPSQPHHDASSGTRGGGVLLVRRV